MRIRRSDAPWVERHCAALAGFAQSFAAAELASAAQVLRRLRALLESYGTKDQP
ncbi:MAG TPA: hypothetical protein VJN41_06235 [Alphaproteobacteria bacterium]|nr:hypothetical protein [Alphaproteobacteria bacterium]